MKWISAALWFAGVLFAPFAHAQKWEVGGGVGGSFFPSSEIRNGNATGNTGFDNAVNVGIWLGNNSGRLLGGEFRYDYENTNLKLVSGSLQAGFGAETHAAHYDIHLHFAPSGSRVRPYVSVGGGAKLYRGTGTEKAFQPLSGLALLTKASEIKPLISLGGGVKIALGHALQLRLEARDALTSFPQKVIVPVQGSKLSSWVQDIVVLVGLSAIF